MRAKPVDPAALGPLLADLSAPNGRHVILADAEGEHRLWIRDAAPGQPLGAFVPLDPDFETRITSLLRFYRRLLGRRSGAHPRLAVDRAAPRPARTDAARHRHAAGRREPPRNRRRLRP
uniref:DUF7012 domain-containing protein n=1 Tax=Sphingomonas sp. GlSt437 TaxID=3389970 RepID=UPI003A8BF482